ncbi:MAG: secretin and TonB N-terminal domain-containing protein [Planctomycetota bacterium]|jgi:type II secretory pathway component GspD/PulD (secretin)
MLKLDKFTIIIITLLICPASAVYSSQQSAFSSDTETDGLIRRRPRAELKKQFWDDYARLDKKYDRAKLYFKLDKYNKCIELCNEMLVTNNASRRAKLLKMAAVKAKAEDDIAELEAEREHRDLAALKEVTRHGLVPERKALLPRPEGREVPFKRSDEDKSTITKTMDMIIPEINLVNTDVSYFLQLLFKISDINIIYPPSAVEGKKITIQARNIKFGDILQYLARNQGLHYTVSNNIVWLYSEDDENNGGALFKPEVIPLKTGLTLTAGTSSQSSGGDDDSEAESELSSGNTDIGSMMEWMEENWPGWPEATTWRLDTKMNCLIISSTPDIIDDVRKIVAMLDVPPVQVLITSVFVTISQTDLDQLGFNWTIKGNPQDEPANNNYRKSPNKLTIKDTVVSTGVTGDAFSTALTGVLSEHQFTVTMNAISSTNSAKVLTAPRVIALNNHIGHMRLQRTYRYPTDYESVTSGAANDTSTATSTTVIPSSWEEKDLGFELKVKPSVGADMKNILLEIIPEITDIESFSTEKIITTDSSGNTTPIDIQQPVFSTNTIEAEAVVQDNHTVVIGGLFRDNIGDNKKAVPLLGDIPGLGRLFKTKDKSRTKSCLLIFVTASIITSDNSNYTDIVDKVEKKEEDDDNINNWIGDPTEHLVN